jgi:hypothetical protein
MAIMDVQAGNESLIKTIKIHKDRLQLRLILLTQQQKYIMAQYLLSLPYNGKN